MKLALPWFNKHQRQSGRVGVFLAPQGFGVACINAAGRLEHCQFHRGEQDRAGQLAAVVDDLELRGSPCSIVLHPESYQLHLGEAPPVPESEMAQAVRWKIKEILDYPLEEAAIEYFRLPEDAYRGRQKMLYAATLRKQELEQLVAPVEAAGLLVDCVEVTELALHNLTVRLPTDPGGVAVVFLHDAGGFINLVEEGALYLSRRLDVGLGGFDPVADNSKFFDALYLDIQRSLDFYEAQLGKGIITQLWYAPGLPYTADIGSYLSEQLGLNVSALDLSPLKLVDAIDEELDEQISLCAPAIGAALGPAEPGTEGVEEDVSAAS